MEAIKVLVIIMINYKNSILMREKSFSGGHFKKANETFKRIVGS